MTVDKMNVEEMTASKTTLNEVSVDKMTVGEMSVDKMTVDKMKFCFTMHLNPPLPLFTKFKIVPILLMDRKFLPKYLVFLIFNETLYFLSCLYSSFCLYA
jgi:hypothetical protein